MKIHINVEMAPSIRRASKSRLAFYLALWAFFLMVSFTAYGMAHRDGEILSRVFKLVETIIAFLLGKMDTRRAQAIGGSQNFQ